MIVFYLIFPRTLILHAKFVTRVSALNVISGVFVPLWIRASGQCFDKSHCQIAIRKQEKKAKSKLVSFSGFQASLVAVSSPELGLYALGLLLSSQPPVCSACSAVMLSQSEQAGSEGGEESRFVRVVLA